MFSFTPPSLYPFRTAHTMTRLRGWLPRYFDIGVNFSDAMFSGIYHGRQHHPLDLDQVIARAKAVGVDKMLITALLIAESKSHLDLCREHPGFYQTAGVHPCQVSLEFYVAKPKDEIVEGEPHYTETLRDDVDERLEDLKQTIIAGHAQGFIKAFGEVGLDYDRFFFSLKRQQLTMFTKQLEMLRTIKHLELPLFLHMRAACDDFIACLKPFIADGTVKLGVIHSFTGTEEELDKLKALEIFHFSVNGCSLRYAENVEVAAKIPMDKLMIETDAPWCEVRRTHASYKFITPYPNVFYPDLVTDYPIKSSKFKFDANLPFTSIKKENWTKHHDEVNKQISQLELDATAHRVVGDLASPMIKLRNEPAGIVMVAEIMCGIYGLESEEDIEKFLDTVYRNSCEVFKV